MGGEAILIIAVIAIVGAWIWQIRQSGVAKSQDEVHTNRAVMNVRESVDNAFNSVLWKDVSGPGTINKRRRSANDTGPVISVDISSGGSRGGTHVTVWMSAWSSKLGFANFAGAAVRQKKKVLERLA